MWTEIICTVFGIIIGITGTLVAWIGYDKTQEKRTAQLLHNCDDWCSRNCKLMENCYSHAEDPDDAVRMLTETYCVVCPICKAQEIITDTEVMQE